MQVIRFETGGYCVHKASVAGSGRVFSAWFDGTGRLKDAEARDKIGRIRPVLPMNAPRQCDALQRRYGYLASAMAMLDRT